MWHNCGLHEKKKGEDETAFRNRRVSVEVCHVRSTLKPGEDANAEKCIGCTEWYSSLPDGAVMPCPHCGEILVVITIKKCPSCGGPLAMEEE